MFYLTTHSTHFIYGYRKEGNVLFNTFHLWLYGVRYMVQNHSDSERGYTFFINSKGSFIWSSHKQDNAYHSQSLNTGWKEK